MREHDPLLPETRSQATRPVNSKVTRSDISTYTFTVYTCLYLSNIYLSIFVYVYVLFGSQSTCEANGKCQFEFADPDLNES